MLSLPLENDDNQIVETLSLVAEGAGTLPPP
jgi:hypothetical protein